MIFNLQRNKIESALKLKLVPSVLAIPAVKLLDGAPNFDKAVIDIKVYDKEGKEIDVEAKIKSAVLSVMLGVVTP